MKNILVIGATGFIGKHLIQKLSQKNYKISCLVRETSKKEDIAYLKKMKVKLLLGDLNSPNTLGNICRGIDGVFYLAGGGDVASLSKQDFKKLESYNLTTLQNFLDSIKKLKKIVFFSSISAMGVQVGNVIDENTLCIPKIPHEQCKFQAEKLIKKYSKTKGYSFSILRPSIVYGEYGFGDSFNMIKMLNKGYFFMPGNGNNTTPWVYVDNVVDAAVLLMENGKNQEYIINHKESISFNKIINLVSKTLNKKVIIFHIPVFILKPLVFLHEKISLAMGKSPILNLYRLKSMTSDRIYSINKIEDIGYKEKLNFEKGILKTISWYKKNGYL